MEKPYYYKFLTILALISSFICIIFNNYLLLIGFILAVIFAVKEKEKAKKILQPLLLSLILVLFYSIFIFIAKNILQNTVNIFGGSMSVDKFLVVVNWIKDIIALWIIIVGIIFTTQGKDIPLINKLTDLLVEQKVENDYSDDESHLE